MVTLKYQSQVATVLSVISNIISAIEGASFQRVMEMTDILQLFPEGRNMRSHKNIAQPL